MSRAVRYTLFWGVIVLILVGVVNMFNDDVGDSEVLTTQEFLEVLDQDEIVSMTVQPELDVYFIEGELAGGTEDDPNTFQAHILQSQVITDMLVEEFQTNLIL
ncbi:ATP-dependent metallopeptidase FtsH/Yme1/Tma family protein [Geomicrobium sp. JCM 19039]|uniref:ATP-dependent metallopeptidase FtsH/Yme1/Tma family protein n=1 Tax=Geomicrobium sp. JCM 19039 TaxID=1460636 RepID=UPI0005AA6ADE